MKTQPSLLLQRLRHRNSQRGSVLLTAIIFAVAIAVIVGSYLSLSFQTLKISNRAFYANAAINLAEAGLEQAIYGLNNSDWSTTHWDSSGSERIGKFTDFKYDQNSVGTVQVYVDQTAIVPRVVARATIQPTNGTPIEKWVAVDLTRRSTWANQFVAKDKVDLNGNNVKIRAYFSHLGAYKAPLSSGTEVYDWFTIENDRINEWGWARVGAGGVTQGSLNVGNADIWGWVTIGSSDPNDVVLSNNGTLTGEDEDGNLGAEGNKDLSRVTPDFRPNFEDGAEPTGTITYNHITSIAAATTLPGATDTPTGDTYYYRVGSIALSGSGGSGKKDDPPSTPQTLAIANDKKVVIVMNDQTYDGTISITGNGSIEINSGATLEVYTAADVDISGNGVANNGGTPSNFVLTSTRPSEESGEQTIKISGNGTLSSVVYAPNANVEIKGGGSKDVGELFGGIIANNITVTGTMIYVCDLSLGAADAKQPFGISNWTELTLASERAAYDAKLPSL